VERVVIPLGDRGAGPRVWQLVRIDVDDVTINGGPTTARGTYAVYPANAAGTRTGPSFLACKPETSTGVDVPPGRYRVEVSYRTVEVGEKVDVHGVDVP
jgi:hypothetical protein